LERLGNRQVFKGVVDLRENVLKCDDHKKKKAESQQAVSKELSRSERSKSFLEVKGAEVIRRTGSLQRKEDYRSPRHV